MKHCESALRNFCFPSRQCGFDSSHRLFVNCLISRTFFPPKALGWPCSNSREGRSPRCRSRRARHRSLVVVGAARDLPPVRSLDARVRAIAGRGSDRMQHRAQLRLTRSARHRRARACGDRCAARARDREQHRRIRRGVPCRSRPMLGCGLKLPDAFEHTHLGWIGRRTPSSSTARS